MINFHKIKHDVKALIPETATKLAVQPNLLAIYLFGSQAQGIIRPLSDVDIAVLLDETYTSKNFLEVYSSLYSETSSALKTDEVDLVILNEAPVELQHAIIRDGILLLCKDEDRLAQFKEKVILNYLDTTPLREEIYFHMLERIDSGEYGHD